MKPREIVAAQFLSAAESLNRAAAHCRIAANHFNNSNVPQGCAHAFAASGEVSSASAVITRTAEIHAKMASTTKGPDRMDEKV